MRRLLCIAVLTGAAALSAGCKDDKKSATSGPSAPPPDPGAGMKGPPPVVKPN
jgi:hypothetical protein